VLQNKKFYIRSVASRQSSVASKAADKTIFSTSRMGAEGLRCRWRS